MRRRNFIQLVAAQRGKQSLLFSARGAEGVRNAGGKLARINTDGSGLRILDFGRPSHTGWGPYAFFRDGRVILLSIEMTEDWKTKPFEEYYPRSRTHVWIYDPRNEQLQEIAQRDRVSSFYAPCAILPGEKRLAVTALNNGRQILYTMNLDGTDPQAVTAPNEFVYGVSVSPDGRRFAFHANYRIVVVNIDGSNRREIAGEKGIIYFGTSWSPRGDSVLFQRCDPNDDRGHDWSDIYIGDPEGAGIRALTHGGAAWFAASYGSRGNPGSSSIMPQWSPDGSAILYARRRPGSKTPWEFQTQRPDTNHFNRDFKPNEARGGTQICAIDPGSGREKALTPPKEHQWDFRPEWTADGRNVLFVRAGVGENPAIWIMDRSGRNPRFLTRGYQEQGADFPRSIPAP